MLASSLFSLLLLPTYALSTAIGSLHATRASKYPVSVSRSNSTHTGMDFGFSHAANFEYTATITVNGVPFQVILDTGSSDTWIDPLAIGGKVPPNLIQTGIKSTTTYLDGTSSTGPVVLADVTFGPYTIKNQAITVSRNASADAPQLYSGLIGLGGTAGSSIYDLLKDTQYEENGRAILYNLFEHEPDLPNYTTFLMSRSELGIADGGILTVSEVLSNMTAILDAPQFDSPIPASWTTFVDGIYVNDKYFYGHSNMSAAYAEAGIEIPTGKTVATFDTGASLVLAPNYYVHAIYKNIPGAELYEDPDDGSIGYFVPCNTKIDIAWVIGGTIYHMHPIDAVQVSLFDDGTFACFGSVSGQDVPDADWLMGAAFLRNTYQLYDYGNSSSILAQPYTKLLSIVHVDKAWKEADSMMLARLVSYEADFTSTASVSPHAPTGAQSFTGGRPTASLTSVDNEKPSATAQKVAGALAAEDDESGSGVDLSGLTRNSYVIMGLLGAVVLLLVVVIALSLKSSRANKRYKPLMAGGKGTYESYADPYAGH